MSWEYIQILLMAFSFLALGLMLLCLIKIWLILDRWQERELSKRVERVFPKGGA